ncbi:hypothetical protein BBJ28_00010452 [Nothophytophthora sp. Chile5]|nr:hypothetical protein BBJ28_00010452 [Nothophytophthora sp. Chile5]
MANYRGWIWSLVAVAGTATVVAVAYRYATRSARDRGDDQTAVAREGEEGEEVDYDWPSEDEEEELGSDGQQSEQQLRLVAREGNMVRSNRIPALDYEETSCKVLAMFGLMLMLLVTAVSLVVTWGSEEDASFTELPMFQPLMWIAVGIFTAASMELLTRTTGTNSEVPVLEEKAVFPHDESDFELIRQHDGNTDHEEKYDVPADIEAVIKRADELFERDQHAQTREYLKAELPKYSVSVELVRLICMQSVVIPGLPSLCHEAPLIFFESSPDEKKALAFEGLADAEKAYTLNANSAASNKWMAIMTSTAGNFRVLKEKIAGAYVIRDHIQRAIELDPSDATSHNILGQWCLAFADMTWIEKRAAAALFGTPPTATYEEAVQHFQAAGNGLTYLSTRDWDLILTCLDCDTYMKMKRTSEASKWVLQANGVPVKTKEDEEVQKDIASLMKQLSL